VASGSGGKSPDPLKATLLPLTEERSVWCQDPSAPWPTFARRERQKKSATPVGMTDRDTRSVGRQVPEVESLRAEEKADPLGLKASATHSG
jgi:hypothetical protein